MNSIMHRRLLQVHVCAQQIATEQEEAHKRNEVLVADVRHAHHTNTCQVVAFNLLKTELLVEQTQRHEHTEELHRTQTTWQHDQAQAAQAHTKLFVEYVCLTTEHQLTETQLAVVIVDLCARFEALANVVAMNHILTNEITSHTHK